MRSNDRLLSFRSLSSTALLNSVPIPISNFDRRLTSSQTLSQSQPQFGSSSRSQSLSFSLPRRNILTALAEMNGQTGLPGALSKTSIDKIEFFVKLTQLFSNSVFKRIFNSFAVRMPN